MNDPIDFIAVDLGASNGRILLGRLEDGQINLHELHRFANGPVEVLGSRYWDVLRIWAEIKKGLSKYAVRHEDPLASIGVDTWGVDYALLDGKGRLLGHPYHYRDSRTDGILEYTFERISRESIFARTGVQFMQINTLFQLISMVRQNEPQLEAAGTLLMMPDLFHYWLTGSRASEFTIASTSQMFDIRQGRWTEDLLAEAGIPTRILPPVVPSGTKIGQVRPEILAESGLSGPLPVIAPGSHDTASAVAAIPGLVEESAYISSGTWSIVGVEIPGPIINDRVQALGFTNEGGVGGTTRLLKNITGLWLLQESKSQWQKQGQDYTWEDLFNLCEQAEPLRSLVNPDALDFLNPDNMPAAISAYCRRTGQPDPDNAGAVIRCCLESLALKYRWVLGALEELTGRQIATLRVVGGGSQNEMLSQFTADACQRPVSCGPVEATALGNVMLQAVATGHIADITAGRRAIAASFSPKHFEPAAVGKWNDAFGRFRELLEKEDGIAGS